MTQDLFSVPIFFIICEYREENLHPSNDLGLPGRFGGTRLFIGRSSASDSAFPSVRETIEASIIISYVSLPLPQHNVV
jgi:hypothetical protein